MCSNLSIHRDLIPHLTVGQIIKEPEKVDRLIAIHGGALTTGGREEMDFLIGMLTPEAIHQIHFSTDCPLTAST